LTDAVLGVPKDDRSRAIWERTTTGGSGRLGSPTGSARPGGPAVSIETHVDGAIKRVDREIDHFGSRLTGVEQFERQLSEIQPATGKSHRTATDGGVQAVSAPLDGGGTADHCEEVRESFGDTVYPHTAGNSDESVLETIGEEFGDRIALALAPGTDQQFTPGLKRTILSATREREAEIESMQRALETERTSLVEARSEIQTITEWLSETDQTPLLELDFEELQERHETLDGYLDGCDSLVESRQETIHSTTSPAGAAGVEHHPLVEFLYQSFPVSYPVLGTIANLDEVCRTSQRRVRDHMVRRV